MSNDYFNTSSPFTRFTTAKAAEGNAMAAALVAAFDKLPGQTALATGTVNYAADTGVADAYVVTLSLVTSYTTGLKVRFLVGNTNTGASTLNVSGLGARAIRRTGGTDLAAGDLAAGSIHEVAYNGTYFELLTAVAADVADADAAATAAAASASAASDSADAAATSASAASDSADAAAGAVTSAIGSTVQAYDAGLTEIAALSMSNDRGLYYSSGWQQFTLSPLGRTLIAQASKASMLSYLGVTATNDLLASDLSVTGDWTAPVWHAEGTEPPGFRAANTSRSASFRQSVFEASTTDTRIVTRDASETLVSVEYYITLSASGATLHTWRVGNADALRLSSIALFPTVDNAIDCGKSDQRWDDVWATNGTIQTSDEVMKAGIKATTYGLDFLRDIEPKEYRFVNGRSGRTHVGLLADDVKAAVEKHGRTTQEFAGYVQPETGPAGLRYTEFIGVLIRAVQELADRVEALEAAE